MNIVIPRAASVAKNILRHMRYMQENCFMAAKVRTLYSCCEVRTYLSLI